MRNNSNSNPETKRGSSRIKSNRNIDRLDTKIIIELLTNPDIQSNALAKKLGRPLSTIQRRKNDLERSGRLKKTYQISAQDMGWRNAEVLMLVEKGKADYIAQELLEKFDSVIATSIRLNTQFNLAVFVGYKDSAGLHNILEQIRAIPNVRQLEWSEVVSDLGNKSQRLAHLIFNTS